MDLSVLIPARNEEWLRLTVEDVLAHSKAETEVIVVLDGAWAAPPLVQHPRVTVVHHPESIGQRAATNEAARISTARYVMKLDAHCSLADGFDVALIEAAEEMDCLDDVTQIPAQKNLHVFDWVCDGCGRRIYQGPTPTQACECGGAWSKSVVWKPRRGVTTKAWSFDSRLQFQYDGAMAKRMKQGDFVETMSCLGACFFMSRDRYWKLGGLDEGHGSWGQMGTEIGCKSWLSGGRMVTNLRTWFAHMFRTQGGDFSFPYPLSGSAQEKARRYSRDLWTKDRWPGQVRPLSWMLEHFAPVPGWEVVPSDRQSQVETVRRQDSGPAPSATGAGSSPTKGIVYYSDCRGDTAILAAARAQLDRAAGRLPISSVTLEPIPLYVESSENPGPTLVLAADRGYLTMFRQILAGLERMSADVVFLAEHDVLYHPSHFDFTPPRSDTYYYNRNVWKVDAATGRALHYDCDQTSGLCASRELLLQHYRARVARVEREGFTRRMGFEPGTHRTPRGVDDFKAEHWTSRWPNVDIRHGSNLTPSRWRKEEFRDQRYTAGWREAEEVPGWGRTFGRFPEWLAEVSK